MSVVPLIRGRSVLADHIPGALARDAALVVGGAALTGVAAQITFGLPGALIPMTGQTFGALLVGITLGSLRGSLSMIVYLVGGMLGVPWFAGATGGPLGPTGGYVVGFVGAAALLGWLAKRGGDRTPLRVIGTMALGNLVIYICGVSWLMFVLGVDLKTGLVKGLLPFLIGDVVKIAIAAAALPAAWSLMRHLQRR